MEIGDGQGVEAFPRREMFSDSRRAVANDNFARAEGAKSEFVGRNEEIRILAATLEESFSGQGLLCSLTGPPGIGKTRLASELASRALERGAQVVWGRCSTFEVPPYWPWIQIIRRCSESDRDQIAKEGMEICHLLESKEAHEKGRFQIFDRVANFLRKVATSRPLLLVIDNLEAADELSLLFLGFVARELSDAAILGLIIYRHAKMNPSRPCGQLLQDVTLRVTKRVSLEALTQFDVGQLISRDTPPGSDLGIVKAVYQNTGGNPMFTEILLRHGLIDWQGRGVRRSLEMLRPAVERYLSSVSLAAREVLELAAVIGNEFEFSLIREASGMGSEQILGMLTEGVSAVVLQRIDAPGRRYRFVQELIRETLCDALDDSRRARLHVQIAEALENSYESGADVKLADIAYHFVEGATLVNTAKGFKYSQRAAEEAVRIHAWTEAARLYQMALSALEFYPYYQEAKRHGLLLALADSQRRSGDTASACLSYQRATDLARRLADSEQTVRLAQLQLPALSHLTPGTSNLDENTRLLPDVDGDVEDDNCVSGQSSSLENLKKGLLEVTGFEKGGRTRLGVTHCLESEQLGDFDPAKTAETRSARAMEQLSAGLNRGGIFRREGEYWTIVYEKQTVRIRHSKGLAYIAYLIRHAGRELHVTDLATLGESDTEGSIKGATRAVDASSVDIGPALDAKAKASYRQRLRDLREDREEANSLGDLGRLSRIEVEIEFLSRELARAVGLGGRDRRVGSELERARLRVTNAVRSAIKKTRTQCPELGQFLSKSIRTGCVCSFEPGMSFPGFLLDSH
jgi:AAA ATPase domain